APVAGDHRQVPVRGRGARHVLARDLERRISPATDVAEAVVPARERVLDQPDAADDLVVAVADARVRSDPVRDRQEAERAGRRGAVALALVVRDAALPEPGGPGTGDGVPAAASLAPDAQRSLR